MHKKKYQWAANVAVGNAGSCTCHKCTVPAAVCTQRELVCPRGLLCPGASAVNGVKDIYDDSYIDGAIDRMRVIPVRSHTQSVHLALAEMPEIRYSTTDEYPGPETEDIADKKPQRGCIIWDMNS